MSSFNNELNQFMIESLNNSIADYSLKNKIAKKMLELINSLPDNLTATIENPRTFDYHEYFFSDKINADAPTIQDMVRLDDTLSLEILFQCKPVYKNYIKGKKLHLGKMIKENVSETLEKRIKKLDKHLSDYNKKLKAAKKKAKEEEEE